jgi:pimeloyl-ACP methyl ester carboxylesterase
MLVHGFPQNWWEWHELIGPLAADGYRVLCPDLRGAGWSFGAQRPVFQVRYGRRPGPVLDRLDTGAVRLVARLGWDVAFLLFAASDGPLLRSTSGPWYTIDGFCVDCSGLYQLPIA